MHKPGPAAHLVGHVVGDEAEVARVNADAISAEDAADLCHYSGASGLDAKSAQHCTHVVGGDGRDIHEVTVGPCALKIDAICLHRHRGSLLARLLLDHIAAVDACGRKTSVRPVASKCCVELQLINLKLIRSSKQLYTTGLAVSVALLPQLLQPPMWCQPCTCQGHGRHSRCCFHQPMPKHG